MYKSIFAVMTVAIAAVFALACAEGPTNPAAETDALAPLFDATAAPTRTSFEGWAYLGCTTDLPDWQWVTPGGTLHFRNSGHTILWDMGHQLIDGIETVEGDLNLNFNGGVGFVHVTSTLVPSDAGVNGTWEIKFHIDTSDETAHGVGHGTGDLRGMSLEFSNFVTIPPLNPCRLDRGAYTTGIITTPLGP